MTISQGSGWVRYGLPSLILGFVAAFGLQGWGVKAQAQQGPGAAGGGQGAEQRAGRVAEGAANGTIAFTTQLGTSTQLLYVIDSKTKAFAVYRIDPNNSKGMIKFEASRQYQWDLKLSEYNNQEPNVAAIESTVNSLGQPTR